MPPTKISMNMHLAFTIVGILLLMRLAVMVDWLSSEVDKLLASRLFVILSLYSLLF